MEKTYHLFWEPAFGTYFQNKHRGVVTVVTRYDEQQALLCMGFSFCSPKDHFSRKKGRDLAKQRIEKIPLKVLCINPSKKFVLDVVRSLNNLRRLVRLTPEGFPLVEEGFKVPCGWFTSLIKRKPEHLYV
jgi:hypothetical protein